MWRLKFPFMWTFKLQCILGGRICIGVLQTLHNRECETIGKRGCKRPKKGDIRIKIKIIEEICHCLDFFVFYSRGWFGSFNEESESREVRIEKWKYIISFYIQNLWMKMLGNQRNLWVEMEFLDSLLTVAPLHIFYGKTSAKIL